MRLISHILWIICKSGQIFFQSLLFVIIVLPRRLLRFSFLSLRRKSQHPRGLKSPYDSYQLVEQDRLNFLLHLLQATAKSKGDLQFVYQLLEANTDKLDDNFIQLFQAWTTETLAQSAPEKAQFIAVVIFEFSALIAKFPLGRKAINLEIEIAGYHAALSVCTREAFPQEWATIQSNLGAAYRERIRGEKAQNLELAIAACRAALSVYTLGAFSEDWSRTQNNLANAYSERIRGDKAQNLESAIAAYHAALSVYTLEAFPEDWVTIQNNLGVAYSKRIRGEKAENLESAISAYCAALSVYTLEAFPANWARTQHNLANAYRKRIRGERAQNVELAITACHAALSVYTLEAFPEHWAGTQHNLGLVYCDRISGERAQNLELAITAFKKALAIRTPTTLPLDCFGTGANLGNTAFTEKLWTTAIEGYEQAIEAVELIRSWATSDTNRQEILTQTIDVYQNLVQACINNGQLDKAIEYAERSRSRLLVDLMASNDLYASGEIPPEVKEYLQQYESLQQEIDEERDRIQFKNNREMVGVGTNSRSRAALEADNEKIQRLEAEKQQIWSQIRRLDPVLAGEIQVSAPDFAAMQQLMDLPNIAILSFYTTSHDTHIFILRKEESPRLHTCLGQGVETLQNWIVKNWLIPYVGNKSEWISRMSDFLEELAERLKINDLVTQYLEGIEELILIPHLCLHQIPFAALPLKTGFLGDKFLIRYAPSCQILAFCHQRPTGETLQAKSLHYGIVENATDDLHFTSFECEKIAQLFPHSQRLQGSRQATVSNYQKLAKQVKGLHSSHHAQSRLDNLLESRLYLGDGSITLGQLMSPGWRLPQLLEVFLSCCETNLGIAEITDDILTLSTGFLCAGARSVISTLWAVDDLATALFSIFYYQYRQEGHSRAEAVRKSQVKLRTLSGETLKTLYQAELNQFLEIERQKVETARKEAQSQRNKAKGTAAYEQWDQEYKRLAKLAIALGNSINGYKSLYLEPLPFAHPRYWAAFTCQGMR